MRIAIVGGPRTGKTTLARKLSDVPVSTDAYLGQAMEPLTVRVRAICTPRDEWVLEGCRAIHALHAGVVPELVLWMRFEHGELDAQQYEFKREIDSLVEGYIHKHPEIPVCVDWV